MIAWQNIQERLIERLTNKAVLPDGAVWIPDEPFTIDDWLASSAQTDEEMEELSLPRIRFLQNRFRIDKLLELDWDNVNTQRQFIWVMHTGLRAYFLISNGPAYQVIGAVEPDEKPLLYDALVAAILQNPRLVPSHPDRFHNYRPDLVPDSLLWNPAHAFDKDQGRVADYRPSYPRTRNGTWIAQMYSGLGNWTWWMG